MSFLQVHCAFCKKIFLRQRGRINEAKKFSWRQFCSLSCLRKAKTTAIQLRCSNPQCKNIFLRQLSSIKKVERSFCSNSCAAVFNNQQRTSKISPNTCANPLCGKYIARNRKFCSAAHLVNPRKFSDTVWREKLITKVILFHKLTGRIPLKREMNGVYKTARQFFGTWNNMIKAAGLHPNPIRFAERQIAKDGHSCDSIAEKLIDDWLSSHNITHSRNTPYPNTKYTADFFVDGKFVEFFGLAGELNAYDETIKRKEKIAEANSMKLIKIYPRDLFPSARLEGLLKNLHEI